MDVVKITQNSHQSHTTQAATPMDIDNNMEVASESGTRSFHVSVQGRCSSCRSVLCNQKAFCLWLLGDGVSSIKARQNCRFSAHGSLNRSQSTLYSIALWWATSYIHPKQHDSTQPCLPTNYPAQSKTSQNTSPREK